MRRGRVCVVECGGLLDVGKSSPKHFRLLHRSPPHRVPPPLMCVQSTATNQSAMRSSNHLTAVPGHVARHGSLVLGSSDSAVVQSAKDGASTNIDPPLSPPQRKSKRLSAKQLAEMHRALSPDANGDVPRDQLEIVLQKKMGMDDDTARQRTMQSLLEQLDPHGTGHVFLPDFIINAMLTDEKQDHGFAKGAPSKRESQHIVQLLSRSNSGKGPQENADETFELLDVNRTGVLGQEELERLFTYSGAYDSRELAGATATFIKEMNPDGGDEITREAFTAGVVDGKVGRTSTPDV
jgi:Ca2+-binding EF-hand superfamily protein